MTAKNMMNAVCTYVADESCMVQLSDGFDGVSFISDAIGKGVLKTLVKSSIPGACTLAEEFFEDGNINAGSLIENIPEIVSWYKTLVNDWNNPLIKDYLPKWPAECGDSEVNGFVGLIDSGMKDPSQLVGKICAISAPQKSCLNALGRSLDSVAFIQSIVKQYTGTSAASLMELLTGSLLGTMCSAIGESIDVKKILEAVPQIISIYQKLDLPILRDMFPKIHAVMMGSCGNKFGKLSADIAKASGTEIVNVVCSQMASEKCVADLSDGLDEMSFVTDAIGKGTLKTISQTVLPSACGIADDIMKDFSADSIISKLPQIFTILDDLKKIDVIGAYIPAIPANGCREKYRLWLSILPKTLPKIRSWTFPRKYAPTGNQTEIWSACPNSATKSKRYLSSKI